MTIALVGTPAHNAQANGSTAFTAALPQAATAGNALLIAVAFSAAAARTITLPGTWTLLGQLQQVSSTSLGGLWVIGKIAAGGETGPSIAWTGGTMIPAWATMELSGVDAGTFPAAPSPPAGSPDYAASVAAGPTSLAAGSRTAVTDDEAIVSFFGGRGPTGGITHTWDANETEIVSANSGQAGNIYAAWQTVATAGTVRTPSLTSFTNSQGNPATLIGWVALKPTGGGGGGGGSTTRKVRDAGSFVSPARKVRVAGSMVTATRKVRVAGTWT